MPNPRRITVLGAGGDARRRLADQLFGRELTFEAELAGIDLQRSMAAAEPGDLVVVIAAAFDPGSLVRWLRALEDWSDGPAAIIVTDGALAWSPTVTRDRVMVVVTSAVWNEHGPDLLTTTNPRSLPELPFTD